jgi:hypothetical protein
VFGVPVFRADGREGGHGGRRSLVCQKAEVYGCLLCFLVIIHQVQSLVQKEREIASAAFFRVYEGTKFTGAFLGEEEKRHGGQSPAVFIEKKDVIS